MKVWHREGFRIPLFQLCITSMKYTSKRHIYSSNEVHVAIAVVVAVADADAVVVVGLFAGQVLGLPQGHLLL